MRPVKPRTTFKGRVRFENLSDVELGALLSALQLPSSQRHQIGMGKPLGMGSVRIEATLHITKRTGEQNRYTRLFTDDGRFHLGELADKKKRDVEEGAKKNFRETMVLHYNSCVTNHLPNNADLWDIPRLKLLALMLEWENPRTQGKTEYEPLGNGRIWRDRRVLPTPHGVVGDPEPAWSEVSQPEDTPTADSVSASKTFKKGDKVRVEIIAKDGNRFTLRVTEPDHNEQVVFEKPYWPKSVGEKLKVTIESVGPDGQIKKVRV